MALTPPENSVSANTDGETGPDVNSGAGERPSPSTTGPAEAALVSGTGGAWTRGDGAAEDSVAAKTGAAAEVADDDDGGVSGRGENVGSSGEGDAGELFVEMCQQPAESEALEEMAEGGEGGAQMAQTGEVKNVEAICEETMALSISGEKAVSEGGDALVVTDLNSDTSCIGGSGKANSDQVQVESAHAREELKKKRGMPMKSTMNGRSNADDLPSGDKQRPGQSSIKKRRGRFHKLALEIMEDADHLPDESAQLDDALVVTDANAVTSGVGGSEEADSAQLQVESAPAGGEWKKKRGRLMKSTMNGRSNAEDLPSADQQCPGKSSIKKKRRRFQKLALESIEQADHLPDETAQLEEHVSGVKRKKGSVQYTFESPEHADGLYDENVLSSPVQHAEHVDDLFQVNVQAGEPASSLKKKGRPGRPLMEETEHAGFFYPFQDEKKGKFSVSDLVWGKVRSHPWWPGQIFDASYASKLASDVRKKDQFLVAYFGDKTFAWCDESQLKPFQKHFAQLVKCCSMDTFVLAVDEALAEASRRLELGMSCSCQSGEAYSGLKEQKVVNAGIREGTISSMVDGSWIMNSFQPGKLMGYLLALARAPYETTDRLECAIANAQVKAFHRSKGYPELPVFVLGRWLENDDQDGLTNKGKSDKSVTDPTAPFSPDSTSGIKKPMGSGGSSFSKKDFSEDSSKEKILFDLVEENADMDRFGTGRKASLKSSGRKQKAFDSSVADLDASEIKRPQAVGDMDTKSATKLPKIGERICRIAGLLTRLPPMLKHNAETIKQCTSKVRLKKSCDMHEPHPKEKKDDSKDETLLQLCLDMKLADIFAQKRGKKKLAKLKSHPVSAASNCTQDPYSSVTIVEDIPKEEHLSSNKKLKD